MQVDERRPEDRAFCLAHPGPTWFNSWLPRRPVAPHSLDLETIGLQECAQFSVACDSLSLEIPPCIFYLASGSSIFIPQFETRLLQEALGSDAKILFSLNHRFPC